MNYPIAEKFKAPQGEGLYAGTPMAFIRFVGCSVGKKICHDCDTDFEKMNPTLGGGMLSVFELVDWIANYGHVCLTGGEPLDRNLVPLIDELARFEIQCHIETSGTRCPSWLPEVAKRVWLCVSPKPGYLHKMIDYADEVKVILGGLGDSEGWPTLEDARRWAAQGKLVYIQPSNQKHEVDRFHLDEAIDAVINYPELRLSVQLHKFLKTR